jgi:hypothetical protein
MYGTPVRAKPIQSFEGKLTALTPSQQLDGSRRDGRFLVHQSAHCSVRRSGKKGKVGARTRINLQEIPEQAALGTLPQCEGLFHF